MADPDDPNRTRVVGGYIYAMYWQINEPLAQGVNHVFVPDPPLPPGSFVVADTPETLERVRRAIIGDLRLPRLEDDHAARAVLAALREAGR